MIRSMKRRRIRRARRLNNRIPILKIQPQTRFVFKSINRHYGQFKCVESEMAHLAEEIDWMKYLHNVDDYLSQIIPLIRSYDKIMVEKVTVVLKNIKVQALQVVSVPRDKIIQCVLNDDKKRIAVEYDTDAIGITHTRDVTRVKEDTWYYWAGSYIDKEQPKKIIDNKDKWNIPKIRGNSNSVIKRTFLCKGKPTTLSKYRTSCDNEGNGFTFKTLLEDTAVQGKTKYPHLMVLPDLELRMYGDKLTEFVQYNFIADICIYVHTRLCKRVVDRR